MHTTSPQASLQIARHKDHQLPAHLPRTRPASRKKKQGIAAARTPSAPHNEEVEDESREPQTKETAEEQELQAESNRSSPGREPGRVDACAVFSSYLRKSVAEKSSGPPGSSRPSRLYGGLHTSPGIFGNPPRVLPP
jgi:hypothetical protein